MILAADFPSYLPILDFYYKLFHSDIFVLADDLNFTKIRSVNRGKIKTAQGPSWLTVPVLTKNRGQQEIRHMRINTEQNWREKHWKTLLVNYKYAAYFEDHEDFFEALFKKQWSELLQLNLAVIEYLNSRLDVTTKIILSSEVEVVRSGQNWVIELMASLNADTYLVQSDYSDYLQSSLFQRKHLNVRFFESRKPHYHQQFEGFAAGLSVLDLILNEGRDSREIILSG